MRGKKWGSGNDNVELLRIDNLSLNCLINGDVPYLRLKNFATAAECEALINEAIKFGFGQYVDVEPRIDRIGATVFEYNNGSRANYFADSATLAEVQSEIFKNSFNPVERFLSLLTRQTGYPARIATNELGCQYYAGIIRRIRFGTLLHVDFAPGEQPEWTVGQHANQLAWNVYLRTSSDSTGRTFIYRREWCPEDNGQKMGSYGFDWAIVNGAEKACFDPEPGEVIIFNSKNYHHVEPSNGDRITVSGALSFNSKSFTIWS